MATQRDPKRQAVMCYANLDLLAKVRTAIGGRKVLRKSASTKRATTSMRPMGMADFFIECVENAVKDVVPTRSAVAWCKAKLAINESARARTEAAQSAPEEKLRQSKFQMRAYFEAQIAKKERSLAAMRKTRAGGSDAVKALEAELASLRAKAAEYAEACKAYSDRRRRGSREG